MHKVDKGTHLKYEEIKILGVEMGSYNQCPQPIREITHEEFMGNLVMPDYIDFRQVRDLPGGKYFLESIYVFWTSWGGIAYQRVLDQGGKREGYRYFAIGCEHDHKQYKDDGWVTYYRCSKCGHEFEAPYK